MSAVVVWRPSQVQMVLSPFLSAILHNRYLKRADARLDIGHAALHYLEGVRDAAARSEDQAEMECLIQEIQRSGVVRIEVSKQGDKQ